MTVTAHVRPDGRVSVDFEQPYFVTAHAIRRARQRVREFRRCSDIEIVRAVMAGLQDAGPVYPITRTAAIGERRAAPRFVAICEPALPGKEWPSVVTVWGWGVCPILLRRKRCEGADKRYRWLNGPMTMRGGERDEEDTKRTADHGDRRGAGRREGAVTPYPVAGKGWLGLAGPVEGFPALRRLGQAHVSRHLRDRVESQTEWTRQCLELMWSETDRPYVAYSGGKDSGVLLHLARRLRRGTEAVLIMETEGAHACVHQIADWWRTEEGATLKEHVWGSLADSHREKGRPIMPLGDINRWARGQGYTGVIRGIRADESPGRAAHAYTHAPVRDHAGWWVADPLLWWSTDEIWAYHALHGLPYGDVYDRADDLPREKRRIGSLWGMIGAENGRIARLKRFEPEAYRELAARVPDVRRYS